MLNLVITKLGVGSYKVVQMYAIVLLKRYKNSTAVTSIQIPFTLCYYMTKTLLCDLALPAGLQLFHKL